MAGNFKSDRVLARWSRWDIVSLVALGMALFVHLRFSVADARPPTDLGDYYRACRELYSDWVDRRTVSWQRIDTPYSVFLALLFLVTGPSNAIMQSIEGVWLALLLGGTWALTRAAGGPIAAAVAMIAVAGYPQTHVAARTHWLHHPETAALLGAAGLWALAPKLPRRGVAVAIGTLLMLGLSIRHSGLPFGVPVGVLVVAGAWRAGARRALVPVAIGAFAGVLWDVPGMAAYIAQKVGTAAGYEQSVATPWADFIQNWSKPVAAAVALPALVGPYVLWRPARAAFAGANDALLTRVVAAIALVWLAGAAAAVGLFHVGPENFPLTGVAVAILAGLGAASLPTVRRIPLGGFAAVPVVCAAVLMHGSTFIHQHKLLPIDTYLQPWAMGGPLNYFRIQSTTIDAQDSLPLVERACAHVPAGDPCEIIASHGLFNPSSEDTGNFALFLAGRSSVEVRTPPYVWNADGTPRGGQTVSAIVDVRCPNGSIPWDGDRFGAASNRMLQLIGMYANRQADALVSVTYACEQHWFYLNRAVKLNR